MGDKSGIEWCDATWNPVTGCTKVSAGCDHCYAEAEAHQRWGSRKFEDVQFHEKRLAMPLRWQRPRRIFVNSMSDLFHPHVTDGQIMRVLDVMFRAFKHTFLVLTKRPERMRRFMLAWGDVAGEDFANPKLVRGPEATRGAHPSPRGQLFADMLDAIGPPPPGGAYPTFDWLDGMNRWPAYPANVWLGVSVENQKTTDQRVPVLLDTPAALRFLSIEPLLGPVELPAGDLRRQPADAGGETAIDWAIVGGESGTDARPCDLTWIRRIVGQCTNAEVPVFVKQLGRRPTGEPLAGDADPKGGSWDAFPADLQRREMPQAPDIT